MKKRKNKKILDKNQQSFFFEDYLSTNQKLRKEKDYIINEDRIYILFFSFFFLILIFSLKIMFVSFQSSNLHINKNYQYNFNPVRNDIIDRNGVLLSRNITAYHAAIKPSFIKDKKKFLVKVKLVLPEIDSKNLILNLNNKKYFYLKKRLTDVEKDKLWKLGEKGIIFEPFQTRVYPHSNLYSHIIGQTDYDNYGISGVENYYDNYLRDKKKFDKPLQLTLDTNIQYLIKNELEDAINIFEAEGAASLLMDSENGEVLSLVSLPDYNINKRINLRDKAYMNKVTKGVFELGSIFKTFTVALALEEEIVESETVIKNITKSIKCSIHNISDIKQFPKQMTVEDILVQSSNIGTIKIARKIGEEKYKKFLKDLNLFNSPKFELDEIGSPIPFNWNKCKLETVSFGHGITTTPLQAAAAYATLVNGGKLVLPTLEKNKNNDLNTRRVISEKTSIKLKKILRKVVTDKKGTASLADIYGYNVSGKTGTSEKQSLDALIADYALFVGWGPNPEPEYVAVVILEEAGFGGSVAAPVVRRYFEQIAYGIVPRYLSVAEADEAARDLQSARGARTVPPPCQSRGPRTPPLAPLLRQACTGCCQRRSTRASCCPSRPPQSCAVRCPAACLRTEVVPDWGGEGREPMGSSAKSHTYDVLRNRAREADAQVVNVHLDGRLSRREGHLFHPVGHAKRALRRSSCSATPTALQTAAEGQRSAWGSSKSAGFLSNPTPNPNP